MSLTRKLRISWLWDWEPEYTQATVWEDGLAAAMKVLMDRGHTVQMLTTSPQRTLIKNAYFDMTASEDVVKDIVEFEPDVILHWADMTRPHARPLAKLGIPMAICFAGGEPLGENAVFMDHIFVESAVYYRVFKEAGMSVSMAFGTNTELFKPIEQPKLFDTIFPATFAGWKRHDLYAEATQHLRSLAVGYMYTTQETECWQVCLDHGVMVLPSVSARVLHRLYAGSEICVIPSQSNGGSQRTVLEAMSMNLPLVVCDSDKFDYSKDFAITAPPDAMLIQEAVLASIGKKVESRQFVIDNWSEYTYADSLERGLLSIC